MNGDRVCCERPSHSRVAQLPRVKSLHSQLLGYGLTAWEATACLARLDAFLVALLALCGPGCSPPAKTCPRAQRLLQAWNKHCASPAWWPYTSNVGKWCTKFCCQGVGPVLSAACGGNIAARRRLSRLLLDTLGEQHFPWGLLTPPREQLRQCSAKAFEQPLSMLSWAMQLSAADADLLVGYLEQYLERSGSDDRQQSAAHALLCEGVGRSRLLVALEESTASALDAYQLAAVHAPCDGGAVIIEAGPGAGKTRTLGARCLRLMTQHMGHFPAALVQRPEDIVCVIFTTRARTDLVTKLAESGMPLPTILTLDSFTLVLIGDVCQRARLPGGRRPVWVQATAEQRAAECVRAAALGWPAPPDVSLDHLLAQLLQCPALSNDAASLLRLTKPLAALICESFRGRGRLLRSGPDQAAVNAVAELIEQRWWSNSDEVQVALSVTPRLLSTDSGRVTVLRPRVQEVLTSLAALLAQHDTWFAYDCDRELVALALLQHLPPAQAGVPQWMRCAEVKQAAATVAALFRRKYVLLDEFQDTSVAQLDLLLALTSSPHGARLTVVGDSDQAIYAFRGASVQPLRDRLDASALSCVRRSLSVNYRSTPAIVAVCEALIGPNRTEEQDKAMRPSWPPAHWRAAAMHPPGPPAIFPVSLLLCGSAATQQECCALACIQRWHALGVPYSRMAVLGRVRATVKSFKDSIRGSGIAVLALKEEGEDTAGGMAVWPPNHDALSVGTIHSAKGLEWDVVCIVDALASAQAAKARNERNAALSDAVKTGMWAEERRVVFVGLSRPRRALHITHPNDSRDAAAPAQSDFLQDMVQGAGGAELVVCRDDELDQRLPWPHNLGSLDMGPLGEGQDEGAAA